MESFICLVRLKSEEKSKLYNFYRSVPFELQQVGTNYLRYKKSGQEQLLLRVDVALEGAVIHIQVHHEAKSWPFTIHNTSSVDLQFHQTVCYLQLAPSLV